MSLVIVMGVSGCGKSSVAEGLAKRLGLPLIEGDALHPPANIAKMSAGVALDDCDRAPWLREVGRQLAATGPSGGAVATCSALKRGYRDLLRDTAGAELRFIHLHGSRAVLEGRMQNRPGHFMPAALLDSQLATLEPPNAEADVVTLDCAMPLADVVKLAAEFVSANGA